MVTEVAAGGLRWCGRLCGTTRLRRGSREAGWPLPALKVSAVFSAGAHVPVAAPLHAYASIRHWSTPDKAPPAVCTPLQHRHRPALSFVYVAQACWYSSGQQKCRIQPSQRLSQLTALAAPPAPLIARHHGAAECRQQNEQPCDAEARPFRGRGLHRLPDHGAQRGHASGAREGTWAAGMGGGGGGGRQQAGGAGRRGQLGVQPRVACSPHAVSRRECIGEQQHGVRPGPAALANACSACRLLAPPLCPPPGHCPASLLPQVPEYLKRDCLLFYYPDCEQLARRIVECSEGTVELAEINWK